MNGARFRAETSGASPFAAHGWWTSQSSVMPSGRSAASNAARSFPVSVQESWVSTANSIPASRAISAAAASVSAAFATGSAISSAAPPKMRTCRHPSGAHRSA